MTFLGNEISDRCKLYSIGSVETGITVLSQQIRALNLVTELCEKGIVPLRFPKEAQNETETNFRIAIVGSGFAGLTAAAGLLRKGAKSEICIFEQRDTLLPLQHGSDTRWLHPRIYNWPSVGSESSAAMLPVLNWTAARASDVVVQVLDEWQKFEGDKPTVRLYCNTRHLKLGDARSTGKLPIEWVGEERNPFTGNLLEDGAKTLGHSRDFDVVILAVGFGLEKGKSVSYWRNDVTAQPNLFEARHTFLVSGQGDGAIVDLLRLRISRFRQDRILHELFALAPGFLRTIKLLHDQTNSLGLTEFYSKLESAVEVDPEDFGRVIKTLRLRLRRDTDAILRLKVSRISELFEMASLRISFQNRILLYLLYKCGGFAPSSLDEKILAREHTIPEQRIIRRHGADRSIQLKSVLSARQFTQFKSKSDEPVSSVLAIVDTQQWKGGYFGFAGTWEQANSKGVDDQVKLAWRKEYLPGPTMLFAKTLCACIAGFLGTIHDAQKRLRVTLHRAMLFGANEEVLQQCCGYSGLNLGENKDLTAARTFPATAATIGLAYRSLSIVRSKRSCSEKELNNAMNFLNLTKASRNMDQSVHFVLAIPILEPEEAGKFSGNSPVCGVIYIDSTSPNFYVDDINLKILIGMIDSTVTELEAYRSMRGISNIVSAPLSKSAISAQSIPTEVAGVLELVELGKLPRSSAVFEINFDHSDFLPV